MKEWQEIEEKAYPPPPVEEKKKQRTRAADTRVAQPPKMSKRSRTAAWRERSKKKLVYVRMTEQPPWRN